MGIGTVRILVRELFGAFSLPQQGDSIGVCSAEVVVDSPAIGGFGEYLAVDHDTQRGQSGIHTRLKNGFLQEDIAGSDFPDFEGDASIGFQEAFQFCQDRSHRGPPLFDVGGDGDGDGGWINLKKPGSEPIVTRVVYDIQERGRSDHQIDAFGGQFVGLMGQTVQVA